MAIVSVNKIIKADGASQDLDSKEYIEEYFVEIDTPLETADAIRSAVGIPAILDPMADDPAAFCRSKRVKKTRTRLLFIVVCEFSTLVELQVQVGGEDPLDAPPQIDWDSIEFDQIVVDDITGAPIENSAGDPFDPPLTEPSGIPVVTITRNEADFDPKVAAQRKNRTNSIALSIAGFAAGIKQAKLLQYRASSAEDSGNQYFVVTYKIAFKDDEPTQDEQDPASPALFWLRKILDWGLNELFDTGTAPAVNVIKRHIQLDGEKVDQPQKLDGDGVKIAVNPVTASAVGALGTNFTTGTIANGYEVGDVVDHTGFTEATYNGTFTITAIISDFVYEVGAIVFVSDKSGTTTLQAVYKTFETLRSFDFALLDLPEEALP